MRPVEFGAVALFVAKLHGGLKEVHIEPECAVESIEGLAALVSFKARISHCLANDREILLLDEALVVLLVRPASTERDHLFLAITKEIVVDELGSVVGIEAQEREGESPADG